MKMSETIFHVLATCFLVISHSRFLESKHHECKDTLPSICTFASNLKTCSDVLAAIPGACEWPLSETHTCGNGPGMFKDYCKVSCNVCDECVDDYDCPEEHLCGANGYCQDECKDFGTNCQELTHLCTARASVSEACPKSCGTCGATQAAVEECKDDDQDCPNYVSPESCIDDTDVNHRWLVIKCRKSCGFCDEGCHDTDNGKTDKNGYSCTAPYYGSGDNRICGSFDDDDFHAGYMCCGCGGGSTGEACKFEGISINECPSEPWKLSECSLAMNNNELCQADSTLPDGNTNYEISNCGVDDVFKCVKACRNEDGSKGDGNTPGTCGPGYICLANGNCQEW